MADEKAKTVLDDSAVVRANTNRLVIDPIDLPEYYANDTQLQTTPWDVRFLFGLIIDVKPEIGQATVKRVADVRLSLQHAKKLSTILVDQIRQYEARIGFIALPPEE